MAHPFSKEEIAELVRKHPDLADYETQYEDGSWGPAIPLPFYYGLFHWIYRRLTGWRDEYGRKAQLFWEW